MKRLRLTTLLLLLGLLAACMQQPQPPVPDALAPAADAADLFFSEYVEGSSNNKALEIYNGTGAPVDLAADGYDVQMYFNGSASAGLTIVLTGTVAAGDVFVLAQSSSVEAILAEADQTSGAGWYNGNDVVVLRKDGATLDAIGQIGTSAEWGSGLASTQDNTLRRKATVCSGDADPADAFDPSVEWDGFAQNDVDGLGSHAVADCGGTGEPTGPVINEFSASTTGTDVEYVEIFGAPDTDYGGLVVLEIEGDAGGTGTVDEIVALGVTDADGFYLASLPANALENGTVSLLLVDGFTGALGMDLDTNDDGTLDVTPWTAIVDSVAVDDGGGGDLAYGVPALGPNYDGVSSFAPGGASRIPDGADTDAAGDWVRNDFDLAGIDGFAGSLGEGEALNTPGAPNEVYQAPPPGSDCADAPALTLISALQGDGAVTPCGDQVVTVEGVVVGDYEGPSPALRGFYVQEEDGERDDDPLTSEAVFVFNFNDDDVSLGDVVRVTGTVGEFQNQTQIGSVVSIEVVGSGTVTPTEVELPLPSADHLERVEGMLVAFPQTLYVTEHFQLGRFGQIVMSSGDRLYQPTNLVPAGPEALALQVANDLDRIIVDDDLNEQNPDPILFGEGGDPLTAYNTLRGGDTVAGMVGVMTYTWAGNSASGNAYRLRPVNDLSDLAPDSDVPVFQASNPRPSGAPAVGGSLEIASLNVLNYFVSIDTADTCSPNLSEDCRGADTEQELERQRAKLVSALLEIDGDVVGLIEIENTPGVDPAADIAGLLNAALGADVYDSVDTGVIGTDAIRVGLIYKPAVVLPLGDFAVLDGSVDPRFLDTKNRPALAQSFVEKATGGVLTVAVNHLKSKGSDCNDVGDPDLGDGQGNCNETRTAAAEALADWLAGDPTGSGQGDTLIVGDLNAYAKEDPVLALEDAGYTNLIEAFNGADAYSYVFDGQWGYLDHALAGSDLLDQVTGAAEYHINADEPNVLDYNTEFKSPSQIDTLYAPDEFRVSDHDPVLIGFDLTGDPASVLGGLDARFDALLATGELNKGQANAVTKRLRNLAGALDRGDLGAALDQATGLVDQLDDFFADGTLSSSEAELVLWLAEALVNALS